MRTLESLKKEAKRWLSALERGDADARARMDAALRDAPTAPTLRDVQLALARELGFPGWSALKEEAERAEAQRRAERGAPTYALYDSMADALLAAYRTGTPEAMERHYRFTWHRRPWRAMREYVQLDLGKRPATPGGEVEITRDDARHLVAIEHDFASWEALREATLREPAARIRGPNGVTDDVVESLTRDPSITRFELAGVKGAGDASMAHIARLPELTHLDLSGTAITDRGLALLRELPKLESISLAWTAITDAGVRELLHCPRLTSVNLGGTATGDGALRTLAALPRVAKFWSGHGVTDAGLAALHEWPVFRAWQGGTAEMALLSYESEPNHLHLRGSFTDRGLASLRGLDGLFGLNIDASALAITAQGIAALTELPHLGWLAADAKDDWMPHIARMPALRFLGAQDTTASDDGFVALSASRTLEYLWGRRCHGLGTRGFRALSRMPALRGLSVSCRNVDDAGLAALPDFPALRELMPMDVPDAGYRHVGRCRALESLILMYCRDTTDAATERITGLDKLSSYFNSYTTITDRTPELLATIPSLERVTFDTCHGLTDAGLAALARLPRLQQLSASGRGLTGAARAAFREGVRVEIAPR